MIAQLQDFSFARDTLRGSLNDDDIGAAIDGQRDCRLQRISCGVICQMAVLICLMDSYSDKQQAFGLDVLIEYAQSIAMIDLHIASFGNNREGRTVYTCNGIRYTDIMSIKTFT